MSHLDMGEVDQAKRWLDRAAAIASEHPTPLRARRLASWRGLARSTAGDAAGMREYLERAVQLASESGLPAVKCEALARLALEASRLGVEHGDDDLLQLAERSAGEAGGLAAELPGHPPWAAQAEAALAQVELARGRTEEAVDHARAAMASLESGMHEDRNLDVVVPVANALMASGAPEWEAMQAHLQLTLAMIAQRTMDEDVRVRWFRGPLGRKMRRLAGPIDYASNAADGNGHPSGDGAEDQDAQLLRSLVQGKTNGEIAEEIGIDEQAVTRRLGELFARIGASSRAEATALAFRQRVL
jgi:DNA-binding CsgD family transcriptional regulator